MRRPRYPALALRATMMVAFLATASLAHAESGKVTSPVVASDSSVRALFSAWHPRYGGEPWITDGTREGTHLLRNILRESPGLSLVHTSSSPEYFADLGDGRVAFTARFRNRDGHVTIEPYITDGTREGTKLVREIGEAGTAPRGYTSLGDGRFVFSGRHPRRGYMPCVWASDGSARETKPIVCSDITWHLAYGFTQIRQGEVVFTMQDTRRGWEPWITDGTSEGTRVLRDINEGRSGSNPQEFVRLADGLMLFTASDGSAKKLWATDGTRSGTRVLAAPPSSRVDSITPIGGGKAVFSANFELWITDGTSEGTHMVSEATSAERPRAPVEFTPLGTGHALFAAYSSTVPYSLWVTDGTARGTRLVQEIDRSFRPRHLRALGDGRAIFWQWQADLGYFALWVSDGTRRGTSRVQQFPNMTMGAEGSLIQASSMGDGRVLFSYDNGRTGLEPWVTDGTREGTQLLRNIHLTGQSNPKSFTPFIPAQPD